MAFCKFNTESLANGKTVIDNLFITEYMPYLSNNATKVYTYGLFMCQNGGNLENSMASFCKNIRLPESEVEKSLDELEKNGLVQKVVSNGEESEVVFVSVRDTLNNIKKYDEKLFNAFNVQIQAVLPKCVQISSNQYNEFYALMDVFSIEPEALILIAKYCTNLKGEKVNCNYINAVAKNFALQNARTAQEVNQKLIDLEKNTGKIKELLNEMKIMRPASHDEYQMFLSWKQNLKFDENLILFGAKASKARSFKALDKTLNHYYNMAIFSEKEIEAYENQKSALFKLATSVVKNLGLYYENLEPVVETYVSVWSNKGFENNLIVEMSKMCFKQGIKSLEKMNEKLNALFDKGILSCKAFEEFSNQASKKDDFIKNILRELEINREVSVLDRSFYNTWSTSWNISPELILYSASLSKTAINPFKYMNVILQSFKENNIASVEDAKKLSIPKASAKTPTHNYAQNNYSAEKLNSVFASLDEVEND